MYFIPQNEAELERAITSGTVAESHFLDFKEALDGGTSGNKSLAKDIASFAIDGGVLIYGVKEIKENGSKFELAPLSVEVSVLKERIDQIALSAISPPILVDIKILESEKTPKHHYLIVRIPASDVAPHMVDKRFMARGENTQRALDHSEVLRLFEYRVARTQNRDKEIQKQIDRDPIPADLRNFPHLHLTATPRMPLTPLFLSVLRATSWDKEIRRWMNESVAKLPTSNNLYRTFAERLGYTARRHDGIAFYRGGLSENREFLNDPHHPELITELEISEEGQIRFFNGHVGDSANWATNAPVLIAGRVIQQTREFIDLVGLATQQIKFGGRWNFSIGLTGIAGITVVTNRNPDSKYSKYESKEPNYIAHASGDLHSIESKPGAITSDLVGRLMRSVGMEKYYAKFLDSN